jgi:hypothetical protein
MDEETSRRRARETTEAPLPPERAFVIQLRAQSDPNGELLVGRAEHLASGAAERFGSAAELVAFIAKVLSPETSVGGAVAASAPSGEVPGDSATPGRRTR